MKLQTGRIYLMKYFNYKHDKEPLILVLYHGMDRNPDPSKKKEIVHGINLNYLSGKLTDQVVEMIIQIATKQVKSRDAFVLYHNQLKHRIPDVIAKAYRTYNWKHVGNPIPISKGFDDTQHFIKNLKSAFRRPDVKKMQEKIKGEIEVAKENKEEIKKTYDPKKMTSEQILEFVDNYVNMIQKAKIDDEKRTGHYSKYTKRH